MTSDLAVRLATHADIPALMAVEGRSYVDNLSAEQRATGFVSILHSQRWFADAVDDAGVHLAQSGDGNVCGFIAVTPPPDPAAAELPPIIRAMLKLADELEFRGSPIARQRYAFRGPVVIDAAARGRGLYSRFSAVTRAAYRDRYDIGVLFTAAENPRSVHTTTTKLGAEPLATFEVESKRYHFLAFAFASDGLN
ncbi:MAG: hypothetical protein H6525_02375 [Actinobacteria bacterium]|nr:hypothetical protein [Actinomycetota bacterium]